MIFFVAVNDIVKDSKFHLSVIDSAINKKKILWGVTELSYSTFSNVMRDDFVFFYYKSKIIGIGTVNSTIVDIELSKKKWGVNHHKLKGDLYWSNIIIFSSFHSVIYPFEQIIELGNYSSKFSIRRLIAINKKGIQRIMEKYKTENKFVDYILTNYTNNIK